MKSCQLTHPAYSTDQERSKANPIKMLSDYLYVPGMSCPACAVDTGGTWASSGRVRVDVPSSSPLRPQLRGLSLEPAAWALFSGKLRMELQVPSWMPITPGAEIGLPKAELRQHDPPDFMHPFPGQVIVRARVLDELVAAGLTGFRAIRVQVAWARQPKGRMEDPPTLYELFVTGEGWRVGVDLTTITTCQHCGRTIFPQLGDLAVDEGRWDGTDFFHIDRNPNIVVVSERVCEILSAHGFTNWECIPRL